MAGLILLGLLALGIIGFIVMLITKQGKKRIFQYIGGFFIVLVIYNFYVGHTCGPNSTDVKIMTPQAEAISNYILKNGIPESLSKIPELPYELVDCKKATDGTDVENCYSHVNSLKIKTELYLVGGDIYIDIYNQQSETGIYIALSQQSNNIIIVRKKLESYSTKHDGICNPMRM